ncbi:insulin-like growth factor isoform X2 [Bacillus rossius redtenbacheri]|uniref:insulin-like growth factor isoform X2 n=1 Tax=Bacillus rossius redtenbacheri TaxID=93214 RepID=UPI002FDE286C
MRSVAALALVLLAAATRGTLGAAAPRCGRHLADLLAVVCKGRGFNNPLHPAPLAAGQRGSRARRGVVDECCKAVCPYSTLEQYCEPAASAQAHSAADSNQVQPAYSRVRHGDLPKKPRSRKGKGKGKRRNGKCRCKHRQRRRKLEKARAQRTALQVGTVASPFLGEPVISPQLRGSSG